MNRTHHDRVHAIVVAGHAGDETIARSGLEDQDPRARAAALGSLDRMGALGDDTIRAAFRDGHVAVRLRATKVAAGRPSLATALVEALDDEPGVAENAAFALGESRPPPSEATNVIDALAAMALTHDDSLCREAAVAALGSLGDPRGLDAVLHGCTDRATVRRRAVLALAAFDGAEVSSMLERLTADRDLQVRQAAEDLLGIERGEAT